MLSYKEIFNTNNTVAVNICELAKICWDLQLSDSTGFSISCKITDDIIMTDKTGTGFRRNKITPTDLILIDLDGNFLFSPDKADTRKAPVNAVIHLEGYKVSDAIACIHWHDPYTNAFSCLQQNIPPFSLQSKLIGNVECIIVDDRKEKKQHEREICKLSVPSGLHSRKDVYFVMKKIGTKAGKILQRRNDEFQRHGIVITHFEHGLFSFGRNLDEAFDNGYRSVRNAQTILYSKLLST
ncbi:MAG: class II aldolase/adducin family protein [Patescibacteria group bacterium]|nr:class II aldolase/adducin family protein [Patescibacteria group bacterium]